MSSMSKFDMTPTRKPHSSPITKQAKKVTIIGTMSTPADGIYLPAQMPPKVVLTPETALTQVVDIEPVTGIE
ncbi:unnamed protein product [Notodromas monacha]|uniref:Uncharacterized protein n=1 Tax=Notodromas monacha TaxID=399045 RepID=A0A7R9GDQ9_9CRUS|nr:unnamed protein product [Notodromas monacha]CAG0918804.1 unnamed protein product [Notodromas monacha]